MKTIIVKGRNGSSRILVNEPLDRLSEHLPPGQVYIITDKNVEKYYAKRFPSCPTFVLEAGESSKTHGKAVEICRWLIQEGAGRDAFILGIGGGVVCDIAGFAASIYMRGVDFGFVATSLLAQVDASIGGKNGINLDGFKNIMGCFSQPRFVLCDPNMLSTLPSEEYKNGLIEAIKHTLIADKSLFSQIESGITGLMNRDQDLILQLLHQSIKVKTDIVNMDEMEMGERRKLNLGHTWGHAVEKVDGIPHGQAVGIGLVFAARLSEHLGKLSNQDATRIQNLLESLSMPTEAKSNPETIFKAMLSDKKKESDYIHFVLMEGLGAVSVVPVEVDALKSFVLQ